MPGTKNVASAVLFVISCIIVPIGWPLPPSAWWMVAFFLPLELTYELLFDVRDIEGDRLTGLTTLATKYGAVSTFNLMRGLIVISAVPLLIGGARLFIAGNIQQWLVVWYMQRNGATQTRVVNAVFLGAAQSLSYVVWVILT
jgi:4-hydroxybenzoate polyprenyltransferase